MPKEFNDTLMVSFYDGKKLLAPKNNKYTRIGEDGRMYLDLNNPRDRAILDIIMKVDKFNIGLDDAKQSLYKCIEREFMIDGTTLFITVEKTEDN